MNKIARVIIKNFWGYKTFDSAIHQDITIFIGDNGTGKTTIINLIAATLLADYKTLSQHQFSEIYIELTDTKSNKKPSIQVIKDDSSDYILHDRIFYIIKDKATDKVKRIPLNDYDIIFNTRPDEYNNAIRYRKQVIHENDIREMLSRVINVKWLSINRGKSINTTENKFNSSIDQKLYEINDNLVRYFSSLNTHYNSKIEDFQKNVIVSLLTAKTEEALFQSVRNIDFNIEKTALMQIFKTLKINDRISLNKLDNYIKSTQNAVENLKNSKIEINDIMSLISADRSHSIVNDWHSLQTEQKRIMQPKELFISIMNNLLNNKKLVVNEKNELEVEIPTREFPLPINKLSSGEKQLCIIFGEALLQNATPYVYIADEPELSLHIKWQEVLIDNLYKLNPYLQIIFATHSPDIVSHFDNNVFDMDDIIK